MKKMNPEKMLFTRTGRMLRSNSFDDGNKESDDMLTMMKVRMRVKRKTSRV